MSNFAVLQYRSGGFAIIEIASDCDPVELARRQDAFLVGLTASKSRAEFILNRERGKAAAAAASSSR